ncbi:MAG: hypothetical protein ACREXX_12975 [Gammaproteobacteria bacterium]
MALTQAQRATLERARSLGGGGQAVALSDDACRFLVGIIARDLGLLAHFPEVPKELPAFFGSYPLCSLELPGNNVLSLFARLVDLDPNADTYFGCVAALHKARLKYERILQVQPLPTIDQVGPRGLLQFGTTGARALTGFLLWRKWLFDIDNRAGQETGYLFEPIIAAAIGGVPAPSRKSPIKRTRDPRKSRQVDCIRGDRAYEFKIRVTIAASGQGRWAEELEFPLDCRQSGFVPVLVVLDPTTNPKLTELSAAFRDNGGEVYVGTEAWRHLEATAGPTLGRFLETYVHGPIADLLAELPEQMPELLLNMTDNLLTVSVDGEEFSVKRAPPAVTEVTEIEDEMPEDADDEIGGP